MQAGYVARVRRFLALPATIVVALAPIVAAIAVSEGVVLHPGWLLGAIALALTGGAQSWLFIVRTWRVERALARRGVPTDATVLTVREQHVAIPSGYTGWVTHIGVSFTGPSGDEVSAGYRRHARVTDLRSGDTVPILYDPDQPSHVRPADSDARVVDSVFMAFALLVYLAIAAYLAWKADAWPSSVPWALSAWSG
jgi:hypothetical protein